MSAAERQAESRAAPADEAAEGATRDAAVGCRAAPSPDENCTASTAVTRLAMRLAATTRRISLARMSFASLYPCFLLLPPSPASPGKPSSPIAPGTSRLPDKPPPALRRAQAHPERLLASARGEPVEPQAAHV